MARTEFEGGEPGHLVGRRPDHQLTRAATDVDPAEGPGRYEAERPRRAAEGEPRLLLGREHDDLEATCAPHRGEQGVAVGGLPDRRRGDAPDVGGPDLPRRLELRSDDGDHFGDFVRADLLGGGQPAPDVRERPLLVNLDEPPVLTVGDEQPRRVRTDVDAGAAHDGKAGNDRTRAASAPPADSTDVAPPAWRHGRARWRRSCRRPQLRRWSPARPPNRPRSVSPARLAIRAAQGEARRPEAARAAVRVRPAGPTRAP